MSRPESLVFAERECYWVRYRQVGNTVGEWDTLLRSDIDKCLMIFFFQFFSCVQICFIQLSLLLPYLRCWTAVSRGGLSLREFRYPKLAQDACMVAFLVRLVGVQLDSIGQLRNIQKANFEFPRSRRCCRNIGAAVSFGILRNTYYVRWPRITHHRRRGKALLVLLRDQEGFDRFPRTVGADREGVCDEAETSELEGGPRELRFVWTVLKFS